MRAIFSRLHLEIRRYETVLVETAYIFTISQVKIWKASDADNKWSATTLKLPEAATAVDFSPACNENKRFGPDILIY